MIALAFGAAVYALIWRAVPRAERRRAALLLGGFAALALFADAVVVP